MTAACSETSKAYVCLIKAQFLRCDTCTKPHCDSGLIWTDGADLAADII